MISYRAYLIKQRYSLSSIESYLYESDKFTEWLQYDAIHFNYKNALDYVTYLQKKYNNLKTINHKIVATRHYFNYLIAIGIRSENPFTDMLIKGDKKKKLLHNLLSMDELEDLYYSYAANYKGRINGLLASKRNKVMVGLMVYQGLSTSDMKRLQTEHIQLSI